MPTYRYNCGKSVDIGFNDADPCRAILTDHVYTILLIGEGSVTLRVDGKKLKGLAPCLVPLKENQLVEFVSSRRLSAQRLYFDVAFLYRSISFQDIHSGHYRKMTETMDLVPLDAFVAPSRSGSLPLSHHEHQRACHFFAGFQSAILNQSYPRWPCLARQYLNGLLEFLHQLYIHVGDLNTMLDAQTPRMWISVVLKKIHTRYADPISLKILAQEMGINKDTMSKKFKDAVGCSVGEYILDYRIRNVCHSLVNTDESIRKVADTCGFSSEAYFYRQFKKKKQTTPALYRKHEIERRRAAFLSLDK